MVALAIGDLVVVSIKDPFIKDTLGDITNNIRLELPVIMKADHYVTNMSNVYYGLLGNNPDLKDIASQFIKSALEYFEIKFYGNELEGINCNTLSFLYEKIGNKQKAKEYMQRYLTNNLK